MPVGHDVRYASCISPEEPEPTMFTIDAADEPDRSPHRGREPAEAERILGDLRALRRVIVEAWGERAVILTNEEQRQLQAEIQYTCDLLRDLTADR